MNIRRVLNALPFGFAITIAVGAASVGPDDVRSNLSKWVHWLGFSDLPTWLIAGSVDYKLAAVVLVLGAVYGAFIWGWPRLKVFRGKIPIEEGARLAYEAAERAGSLDLVDSPKVPPASKLDHFKYAMLVDDEVQLYGVKVPSTQLLPIARKELSDIYPVTGLNQLNYTNPYDRIAYTDVMILVKDLRGLIRRYVPEVRSFRRRFGLS